ncbi:hypothetical protein OZX73_04385 [Bifidobacterium sp. ESL0775]|uniref:hypothetical protein n=1 Tax=Bifidobacterium sp. ESL0775 TaxID=2983230 RepID=UPI0023F92DA0|nr:hypothetical protein [Bifidobacterium sp. ESL0775]WEV68545.1 hypothetical protein OZX73_04385 [Bifidobacterium sp. ESL0775]
MPWWGWIILAVLMLAVLIIGLVYAGIHAVRAAHSIADTGSDIQGYLSVMQESSNNQGETAEPPLFTQPLSTAAHRYSLAQTSVERRRIAKHNRHAERWSVWRHNRVPFTGNMAAGSNQAVSASSNQALNQAFDGIVQTTVPSANAGPRENTNENNPRTN